ncbi:hypothetical protein Tco_0817212 [Tanacetum coccineum]
MFQQHQGGKLRRLSAEEAWETIEDCAQYDRKCSNPTSAISNVTIANPNAQIVRDDMVRVQVPRCMAWLDYDEHVDSLSTMDNEVGVTSPESTIQTLPSFEEYTPPVTYPKKVEKTLGTPIEVEPLNKKKLEEVGSNCNHNTPLSSREISSFDGPEPQPLLNSPSLDVSLGDVIGLEPPIKSHSPNSSRMKVVDYLTTQTPPSPHVTNSHPKGVYSYYNPGINDPKRHYGFKPGLIGKSVSLGVDILNWEMFEDDWGLESKEVSPLREELNLFDRPNEVERGRILKAHLLAYRVGLSYLDRSTSSVGRKSNAIFALPGDGSTSSIGHKSNVIFALPGHGSTSSVDSLFKAREDDERHQESRQDRPDQIMHQQHGLEPILQQQISQRMAPSHHDVSSLLVLLLVMDVHAARPKAVLNAVKGNQVNAAMASACWGNLKIDLQDQGVIDSGCSKHMTGNMSYLTDFEEIDGGYVAFGGNPKGEKITGRCTIKTGKLDFKNVYFVRELQFNLFSVSQMCDKKNSVLFNDTECIVLSLNFKLNDESHVLLKVPRKNNMYSVDLKNIIFKRGLTCLFAKATSDEFKL